MINVEMVKKYLPLGDWRSIRDRYDSDPYDDDDYRGDDGEDDYSLRATCSMWEINTASSEEILAFELADVVAKNSYKAIVCNITNMQFAPIYEKFGFKQVFTYMGNHEKQVTTFLIDLNGVTFDALRPAPPLPKLRKQGQPRGLV